MNILADTFAVARCALSLCNCADNMWIGSSSHKQCVFLGCVMKANNPHYYYFADIILRIGRVTVFIFARDF